MTKEAAGWRFLFVGGRHYQFASCSGRHASHKRRKNGGQYDRLGDAPAKIKPGTLQL
jgi:hypothetical protein